MSTRVFKHARATRTAAREAALSDVTSYCADQPPSDGSTTPVMWSISITGTYTVLGLGFVLDTRCAMT